VSDFAAWTGETTDAAEDAPAAPGVAAWLPARVQRVVAAEAAAERRQARQDEAERADRREQKHEAALGLYRRQAEDRGEVVSAMAIARGEGLGRSIGDVLGQAAAEADRQDAVQAARERRESGDWEYIGAGEPVLPRVSRSDGWPSSEYELSRMVRQAQDDRTWMAAYQMRLASRRGEAAAHIEARRTAAGRGHVSRSAQREGRARLDNPEITRGGGYVTGVW
jgi:hypothetical protein